MFNKAILMGRLTKDPELRTTESGLSVCTFSIAVDRQYQAKGEDKKVDFFNIVAWRQTAEFVSKYFAKGRCILVEGEIQNRSYTDKDGNKRYITEIIADRVGFTGEKKSDSPEPSEPKQSGAYQPATGKAETVKLEETDDDYPF